MRQCVGAEAAIFAHACPGGQLLTDWPHPCRGKNPLRSETCRSALVLHSRDGEVCGTAQSRIEERTMSLSVNGSNQTNPFAFLQSLWQQQGSSASGTQAQSDPLSALLATLGQSAGPTSSVNAPTSSGSGAPAISGSTLPQFGPQTLQALLALQANGANPQSLATQFADAASGADPASAAQPGQGHHGHHHHHTFAGNAGGEGNGGGQNLLSMLAGATTQSTANANGSTTTSITYADGSSVSMTTAASGASAASGSSGSSAGGTNGAGSNLIEQLIQMQAQLLTPAAPQSITTA
jgi:hypothetical protein